MNDETDGGIHWSFWAIGAGALIWNVVGVLNFFLQMDADALAAMPVSHRAIVEGRPVWATGGVAIAVFSGALGCLLLLLRKPAAYWFLVASLFGVIVQMIHSLGIMAGSTTDFSPFEISMMILGPPVVGAFLIWYSKQAERKGWISQDQTVSDL